MMGADPHIRETTHHGTPLGWAAHNRQAHVVEYLLPFATIFDAVQIGAVERVAFRNVPAYVVARGVPAGDVEADVAFGGAIYAFVPAARFGLEVRPADLPALIAAGREVKAALEGTEVARHRADDGLGGAS